ncbi:putative thiopurine S-methyltransferase, partial [Armadillidium nasatum]
VEFIEAPVQEFFKENDLTYEVSELPWGKRYETPDKLLKIYVADFYEINIDDVGKFDIIWDRGVLPTVKVTDRERYSKLLKKLCKENFIYLLQTLQHDGETDRNPRPTSHEDVQNMFGDWCKVELIMQNDISEKFARLGLDKGYKSYHLLTPK